MNVKSMARVKYSYNLDGINLTGVATSNVVNTEVRKMGLIAKKFSSSDFYKAGDIMNYNLVITNSGNYTTHNIYIEDLIDKQELLINTIKYTLLSNNLDVTLSYEYEDSLLKINIPFLNANEICVISYKTLMGNSLDVKSSLTLESDEVSQTKIEDLDLKQGFARIECLKKVNDNFTYLNSNLTYELILKNTGNISAYNVEVFDELPPTYELDSDNPVVYNDSLLEFDYKNNILSFSVPEVPSNSEVIIHINGKIIN